MNGRIKPGKRGNEMYRVTRLVNGREITVEAFIVGADIQVLCFGGDKPHIGAVSLAEPYESDGAGHASVSTITALSHREDILSRQLAAAISKKLGARVAVSCGIHYDNITRELISLVIEEVTDMGEELASMLK